MNQLQGVIKAIQSVEGISQITVAVGNATFTVLLLDDHSIYRPEERVTLLFKETEVMIATPNSAVSARNFFVSPIVYVEKGQILAEVQFGFEGTYITSIVTKNAIDALGCHVTDSFAWFVKSNEISLQKE